ncbi:sigma-54 dependent transcriptional regulator [Paralimibaculum aggregatum]|uniref:Sigma-54 dependent transcriptional regulator n=1 Tax=Paralimibaculum aggregatum TaxID=3036245 RepID=A0ABQ6LGE7_9RHOB|nr:sigma-54 dependent transcriptional regulator [Limibaculum sp. NKW23]GMG81491.1 sigma-54 dependent transcriptional regulator [Limibaculum sp. NKW23]
MQTSRTTARGAADPRRAAEPRVAEPRAAEPRAAAGAGGRVLLIEDSTTVALLCADELERAGFDVTHVETGAGARAVLADEVPPVILLDLGLPDIDGIDLLHEIQDRRLRTSVIIITSNGSLSTAVKAMRLGAIDYVVKPFSGDRVAVTVRNAMRSHALEREVDTLRRTQQGDGFAGLVGTSPAMHRVYRTIGAAAASRASVFITGESGTGKELCAQALHSESPRAGGPFVAINCAAIPRELIESELFGHVKGAFTSASSDRPGAASRAHGGTLFLDEICEMDYDMQSKLLRLTQDGSFERVGGARTERVDIRIVCATNRDPWAEVERGRFREDLLYRLNVVALHLPPLRERGADLRVLAETFLAKAAEREGRRFRGFSAEAMRALEAHRWPGNARELENTIRGIVVMNDAEEVTPAMLPERIRAGRPAARHASAAHPAAPHPAGADAAQGWPAPAGAPERIRPMWQVEREAIEAALALCGGNVVKAAAHLEIGASSIYRKKAQWAAEAPAAAAAPTPCKGTEP